MSDLSGPLAVRQFVCSGEYQENCYVLFENPSRERASKLAGTGDLPPCWIIDPGAGAEPVGKFIERQGLQPAAILLTHGHLDHIAGIPELRGRWRGVPIWIARAEAGALQSPEVNLSAAFGMPVRLPQRPDLLLDDGQELSLGSLTFRTIAAPGHSPGGMCYHCPRSGDLFTGDVLFAGSIGRGDLPGGDAPLLVRNIRDKLLVLPGQTRVWPGHGPRTTLAAEKANNPFLQP